MRAFDMIPFAKSARAPARVIVTILTFLAPAAEGWSAEETQAPVGPDVTVFSLSDVGNYGSSGGIRGYSLGTRSCNRGDAPLNWCDQGFGCAPGATSADHPVIAQNLYRLKEGRFEQIGMSWLKHGFVSTNSTTSGCAGAHGESCQSPPAGGNQLGVGCTDPYGSGLNGSRPLGMRSEVNAATGEFPFPYTAQGSSGPFEQRIKVLETDVDDALNPGARFWVEGQYIAPDDAMSGNGFNNASYREVTVDDPPTYGLAFAGSTIEGKPAIDVWKLLDPNVAREDVDFNFGAPPIERFQVARNVYAGAAPGTWHYEYSIRNHNSDRSARAFQIDFPDGTSFTNVGFKDLEHHSGEPYATDDWTISVDDPTSTVSWSTLAYSAGTENANALRWATLFNFWFDADYPPGGELHTLGLFKPAVPAEMSFVFSDIFFDGFQTGDTDRWSSTVP